MNTAQNASRYARASSTNIVIDSLAQDGALCSATAKEYDEQGTFEGGSGLRKLFKEINDKITRYHTLLKVLTGEQRANISEAIPVIDYLRPENTSFRYTYSTYDNSASLVDPSKIIEIPFSSTKPSLDYILEDDPYIINRILLGEPIAEHFYNTSGLVCPQYNIQAGLCDESLAGWRYLGAWRSSDLFDIYDVVSKEDLQSTKIDYNMQLFVEAVALSGAEADKEYDLEDTDYQNLKIVRINPWHSDGLAHYTFLNNGIESPFMTESTDPEAPGYLLNLRIEDRLVILEDFTFNLADYKILIFKYEDVLDRATDQFTHRFKPFMLYARRLKNYFEPDKTSVGEALPDYLTNDEILQYLVPYCSLEKWYFGESSGLLNGLFCEPYEWSEGVPQAKSISSRNVTTWRYCNEVEEAQARGETIKIGAKYFPGHLLHRGTIKTAPFKLTAHDPKFKKIKSDGTIVFSDQPEYASTSGTPIPYNGKAEIFFDKIAGNDIISSFFRTLAVENWQERRTELGSITTVDELESIDKIRSANYLFKNKLIEGFVAKSAPLEIFEDYVNSFFTEIENKLKNNVLDLTDTSHVKSHYTSSWEDWVETVHHDTQVSDGHLFGWDEDIRHAGAQNIMMGTPRDCLSEEFNSWYHLEWQNSFPSSVTRSQGSGIFPAYNTSSDGWYCKGTELSIVTPLDVFRKDENLGSSASILLYPETKENFPRELYLLSETEIPYAFNKSKKQGSTLSFVTASGEFLAFKINDLKEYHRNKISKVKFRATGRTTFTVTRSVSSQVSTRADINKQIQQLNNQYPLEILTYTPTEAERNSLALLRLSEKFKETFGFSSGIAEKILQDKLLALETKYGIPAETIIKVGDDYRQLKSKLSSLDKFEYSTDVYCYSLSPIKLEKADVIVYDWNDKPIQQKIDGVELIPASYPSSTFFPVSKRKNAKNKPEYVINNRYRSSSFQKLSRSQIIGGCPKFTSTSNLRLKKGVFAPAFANFIDTSLGRDVAGVNNLLGRLLSNLLDDWPLSEEEATGNPILLSDLPELLEGLQEIRSPLARLAQSGLELPVNETKGSDYPTTLNLGDLTRLLMRYDADLVRGSALSSVSLVKENIDIRGQQWTSLRLYFKLVEPNTIYVSLSANPQELNPGETPEGYIAFGNYELNSSNKVNVFSQTSIDQPAWETEKTEAEFFDAEGFDINLKDLWDNNSFDLFNKIFGLILRRSLTQALSISVTAPDQNTPRVRSFRYIYDTVGRGLLDGNYTREVCQSIDSIFGNNTLPFINITQQSCSIPTDSTTQEDKQLISSYVTHIIYYLIKDFFINSDRVTFEEALRELYSIYYYDGATVVDKENNTYKYINSYTYEVTKTDFEINFFADKVGDFSELRTIGIFNNLSTASEIIEEIRGSYFSKVIDIKNITLESLKEKLNDFYYTYIQPKAERIIGVSIPTLNSSLGKSYKSFIDYYQNRLAYDTGFRENRSQNGIIVNAILDILSYLHIPAATTVERYFSGSTQHFGGWARAYVKTRDTEWQSFESGEDIVYKTYYNLTLVGFVEVTRIAGDTRNPYNEGWYETVQVLKPAVDIGTPAEATNFYYYPAISWQDASTATGAGGFEKDENGCLLTDLTLILPGLYPAVGDGTATLSPTWDKTSSNIDAASFYRAKMSIPDITGDIDASEPLLKAIADFAIKALEGKTTETITTSYPLRMLESDDVVTGRENSLYFKRYQVLNNRMNRLTGPLFAAARLLRNTEVLADIENLNKSTISNLQEHLTVLPLARMEELSYIPTQTATSSTVALDGRFYYQAEMDAIRERISGKCILTCTHCPESKHCPFYDEEEVLKMYCTPAETIDIYVKDNKLDMIYYDDDPSNPSPDIYEYEDKKQQDGTYVKERVGESISSEVFRELHQPYSEILSKARQLRDDISDNGESVSYAGDYRPLTGALKSEDDILPPVEYELLNNAQLGWNKNIHGGLGWLSGARYGTVEVNDSAEMLNSQFAGLDVPPYKFLYDAVFVADEESEISYTPSNFYEVSNIDVTTQDKKHHKYGGRTKIWLPATLKILADAKPDDDVYLVSDDIRDSNGAKLSPVIYIDTAKALWSRITFGINKSSTVGIQSADDNMLYAQDIAQWSANCCKNHNVYNPGGLSAQADGSSIWANRDQYWMSEIYKKVSGADEDGTAKYIAVPGRLRESSGYQEVLLDADNLDRNQVLAGHPPVADYINFLRKVSIRICEKDEKDPSKVNWLIKWIKDLPTPLSERDKARIEEKRRTLALMKTNLRLVVIHNS